MSLVDLDKLYFSLVEKGRQQYKLGSFPCAKWRTNKKIDARAVQFTRNLIVYYDKSRGYEIVNIDRFCSGQLLPQ